MDTEKIAEIDARLTEIEHHLKNLSVKATSVEETIRKVAAEVMPTINELMKSPMLKMLGVGKKQ
jgi:predicted transcriptional regulator